MKNSALLIFLTLVLWGCNDSGLVSPANEPVSLLGDAVITIRHIPGTYVSLRIMDSLGTIRSSFGPSEPVFLKYSFVNKTGNDHKLTMGRSSPFARFFVLHSRDTLADSFDGLTFAAVMLDGILKNGDSLTADWKIDPATIHLPPGTYMASASASFVIVGLGVPGDCWGVFGINR
jgi:hypothetical protein